MSCPKISMQILKVELAKSASATSLRREKVSDSDLSTPFCFQAKREKGLIKGNDIMGFF